MLENCAIEDILVIFEEIMAQRDPETFKHKKSALQDHKILAQRAEFWDPAGHKEAERNKKRVDLQQW